MCKINNFNDFNIDYLLLEGNLSASVKFLTRLKSINNPISTILYNAFFNKKNIDRDLAQNWIDVSNSEDSISFVSDRNASRLDNPFEGKGRNEVKVGRFTRSILSDLGENFSDKEIEIFVNLYKSSKVDNSKKFELVSGPDIKKYYHYKNYAINSGQLGGSCMRGEDCQSYFKIYTRNTESCQLLVYLNEDNKVLGRALVWKIHKSELYDKTQKLFDTKPVYFMDRVYTANDSDSLKFLTYAKNNNWLVKNQMNNNGNASLLFNYGGIPLYGRIDVELKRVIFREYPYMDTLKFCNGDDIISNVGFIKDDSDDSDDPFHMEDTDGSSEECSNCNGTGYDNNNSDECNLCSGDGEVSCGICNGSGNEICPPCDGGGDVVCKACNGDGETPCTKCNHGRMPCTDCGSNGSNECKDCKGDGSLGDCKDCHDGNIDCKKCKGEAVICKTCKGECVTVRKWGNGTRRVKCVDCDGKGKLESGVRVRRGSMPGCMCDCSTTWYDDCYNVGVVKCKKCEGDGYIKCKKCDGDGNIHCETCDGDGDLDCENDDCRYGRIDCKKCEGNGTTGECKKCNGSGSLGICKNGCDHGQVKCGKCSGSGKKTSKEKDLCPECSGLLDELKIEVASGNFKLK